MRNIKRSYNRFSVFTVGTAIILMLLASSCQPQEASVKSYPDWTYDSYSEIEMDHSGSWPPESVTSESPIMSFSEKMELGLDTEGAVLELDAGIHEVVQEIQLGHSVTLRGKGMDKTWIRIGENARLFIKQTAQSICFEDLTLEYDNDVIEGVENDEMLYQNGADLTFKRCRLAGPMDLSPLHGQITMSDCIIIGNRADYTTPAGILLRIVGYSPTGEPFQPCRFERCGFLVANINLNYDAQAVIKEENVPWFLKGGPIVIEDCTFYNPHEPAAVTERCGLAHEGPYWYSVEGLDHYEPARLEYRVEGENGTSDIRTADFLRCERNYFEILSGHGAIDFSDLAGYRDNWILTNHFYHSGGHALPEDTNEPFTIDSTGNLYASFKNWDSVTRSFLPVDIGLVVSMVADLDNQFSKDRAEEVQEWIDSARACLLERSQYAQEQGKLEFAYRTVAWELFTRGQDWPEGVKRAEQVGDELAKDFEGKAAAAVQNHQPASAALNYLKAAWIKGKDLPTSPDGLQAMTTVASQMAWVLEVNTGPNTPLDLCAKQFNRCYAEVLPGSYILGMSLLDQVPTVQIETTIDDIHIERDEQLMARTLLTMQQVAVNKNRLPELKERLARAQQEYEQYQNEEYQYKPDYKFVAGGSKDRLVHQIGGDYYDMGALSDMYRTHGGWNVPVGGDQQKYAQAQRNAEIRSKEIESLQRQINYLENTHFTEEAEKVNVWVTTHTVSGSCQGRLSTQWTDTAGKIHNPIEEKQEKVSYSEQVETWDANPDKGIPGSYHSIADDELVSKRLREAFLKRVSEACIQELTAYIEIYINDTSSHANENHVLALLAKYDPHTLRQAWLRHGDAGFQQIASWLTDEDLHCR